MGTLWQQLTTEERIASVQAVATKKGIEERAVEKDWWVTAVLRALFNTSCAEFLLFKGGTSLSKGWNLINRFSEDIDLSIDRRFYAERLDCRFAKAETNTQLKNLRKFSRDYIHGVLSEELAAALGNLGITDFEVRNIIEEKTDDGIVKVSHDSDPTVIHVEYPTLFPTYGGDIDARVKIEISCLSMSEPFEVKHIASLLNETFDELDEGITAAIPTVTPSRTFLEKALLLSEEFQKAKPRFRRMSRHLYDLEKIMDTDYGKAALSDADLYRAVVEHRRRFYHLGYVNYDLDYPPHVAFVPQGRTLDAYRKDYEDNMVDGYIYGNAVTFDYLMERIGELQKRFRQIIL